MGNGLRWILGGFPFFWGRFWGESPCFRADFRLGALFSGQILRGSPSFRPDFEVSPLLLGQILGCGPLF